MQEISEKIGNHQYAKVNVCCIDCGKDFTMQMERTGPDQIEIKSGAIGKRDGEYLFKCPECWNADKSFGRDCEIYSRVVGYLRPVSAWNDAKRQEFGLRQNYDQPPQERITARESRYAKAR